MSQRPPATYAIRVTGTGAGGSSDPNNFTLAASGPTTVPGALGRLHLRDIVFEAASAGLTYAFTPLDLPSPPPSPAVIQWTALAAPMTVDLLPGSIDGATTAFPFQIRYGALGAGGR